MGLHALKCELNEYSTPKPKTIPLFKGRRPVQSSQMHFTVISSTVCAGGRAIKNKSASVPNASPVPTCSSLSPNVATSDPAVGLRHLGGCTSQPKSRSPRQLCKPPGQQLGTRDDVMPPAPGWRDSKGHLQGLQITDLAVGTRFI